MYVAAHATRVTVMSHVCKFFVVESAAWQRRARQVRYDPERMRRWIQVLLALTLLAVTAFGLHLLRTKREQDKREAAYQSALRSFSQAFKPGMSRKEVEDYLNAHNVRFSRMCCVAQHTGTFDDLTKIGEEDAPWYCSAKNIYVAFQFTAAERHGLPQTDALDTLREITIFRWLEGCL